MRRRKITITKNSVREKIFKRKAFEFWSLNEPGSASKPHGKSFIRNFNRLISEDYSKIK